jgi:hypothetical protein
MRRQRHPPDDQALDAPVRLFELVALVPTLGDVVLVLLLVVIAVLVNRFRVRHQLVLSRIRGANYRPPSAIALDAGKHEVRPVGDSVSPRGHLPVVDHGASTAQGRDLVILGTRRPGFRTVKPERPPAERRVGEEFIRLRLLDRLLANEIAVRVS